MKQIYFDVTDILHFATRNSRLTGIQRVQVNIIGLLARKHGSAAIRCSYYDLEKKVLFEFSPAGHFDSIEFDAERFCASMGGRSSKIFPSKAHVKSYLRRYNNNKLLRAVKKCDVYLSALVLPNRLRQLGVPVHAIKTPRTATIVSSPLARLPIDCSFVCMGAMWLHPEVWPIAQQHRASGGDVVQMVYDLIPIRHREYFSAEDARVLDLWLKAALAYSSRFTSISNWTGNDLKDYAHALGKSPHVRTVALAHEFVGYERLAAIEPLNDVQGLLGTKYVLCVGTIEHRKNTLSLLQVWRELLEELGASMPLLVFAGKFGSGSAEFQKYLIEHHEIAEYVRVLHMPSDRELAWLYSNSLFTALPSFTEGWGLPVGEGAWFGKLCVASNATSIPEVCGDLMDYVDPHSLPSIKAGIKRALVDVDHRARRELAIRSASLRRWSDVADDLYAYVIGASVDDASV